MIDKKLIKIWWNTYIDHLYSNEEYNIFLKLLDTHFEEIVDLAVLSTKIENGPKHLLCAIINETLPIVLHEVRRKKISLGILYKDKVAFFYNELTNRNADLKVSSKKTNYYLKRIK